jgi:hypothetical protein
MDEIEPHEEDIEDKAKRKLSQTIDAAVDITGVTFGSVAGFLMDGVVGAGAGAAAGTFLSRQFRALASEVLGRHLSPREQKRVGAVVAVAAGVTRELLESGYTIRDDDFFASQQGGRSSAEEIIDGVLTAAQRQHEERKLIFMGNLLARLGRVDERHWDRCWPFPRFSGGGRTVWLRAT